jgi:hypothetical protein
MLSHFSPVWFFGYDVALQFLFFAVSLLVAVFSLRVYRRTYQQPVKLFAASFIFISASYLIQSVFNFIMISEERSFITVAILDAVAMYSHMFFMTIGLSILAYMTFKVDNKRLIALISIISLIAIFLSANQFYSFFLISSLYLGIVLIHFALNYIRNPRRESLLVVIAFVFLMFGSIHFIFSVNHSLFYAIGHVLELVAYAMILINLLMVQRK